MIWSSAGRGSAATPLTFFRRRSARMVEIPMRFATSAATSWIILSILVFVASLSQRRSNPLLLAIVPGPSIDPVLRRGNLRMRINSGSASYLQTNVGTTLPSRRIWGNLTTVEEIVSAASSFSLVVFHSPLISHQGAPSRRSHVNAPVIWSVGEI